MSLAGSMLAVVCWVSGRGVVPRGVAVVVASKVVLDGAAGGAGGEFDRAGREFYGAAGAVGTGRLIVALPASFKLVAAALIASAALISEFVNIRPESRNSQPLSFFLFEMPPPKSTSHVRKHWL
jgi:hypothetical protein